MSAEIWTKLISEMGISSLTVVAPIFVRKKMIQYCGAYGENAGNEYAEKLAIDRKNFGDTTLADSSRKVIENWKLHDFYSSETMEGFLPPEFYLTGIDALLYERSLNPISLLVKKGLVLQFQNRLEQIAESGQ